MDQFDEILRERAKNEPFPLPEGYAGRVFAACAALEEPEKKHPARPASRWTAWAAAALALFIAIPNLSPTAAAAMAEIPVLGAVVRVVTFRAYTYDDGFHSAEVTVPELAGGGAAQEVNSREQEYTDRLMAQFRETCEAELGQEGYYGLDVTGTVVADSDAWFTLRVDTVETRADSGQTSRFYHIDKTTDRVVTLKDLFRADADYVDALSGEVRRQMEEQSGADDAKTYFPEEFTAIDPEQNFYFDRDGNLVLVFDQYTIAPGYMGMSEFTIPAEVYESLLK